MKKRTLAGENREWPGKGRSPFIHRLYKSPQSGPEIEAESFAIIDGEAPPHEFTSAQWEVVRRMIHTVGDFDIMEATQFSPDAIPAGIEALTAGRPIFTDSNMVRSGISLKRLRTACPEYGPASLICPIGEEEIARQAKTSGLPRALFAVRQAKSIIQGGLAAFGNSPVGLLELNRLILTENIRPALVIAMPVGFVHVIESKEELMSLHIPYIVLAGRRGGSPLAVSVIHALCTLAERQKENGRKGRQP